MKRLFLICAMAFSLVSCTKPSNTNENANQSQGSGDAAFKTIHDKYVVEFLRRNPTVNTYLGGAGLDPSLRDVDGTLRDHSAAALEAEDRWLADAQKSFEAIDPNTLS